MEQRWTGRAAPGVTECSLSFIPVARHDLATNVVMVSSTSLSALPLASDIQFTSAYSPPVKHRLNPSVFLTLD